MKKIYLLVLGLNFIFCNAQFDNNSNLVKAISASDGLTQQNVNNAEIDKAGFLWIATQLGLYKYDGKTAKLVTNNNYPSLSSQRIKIIFKDYKTDIIYFIASPEEKCYSVKNNIITQLKEEDGFFMDNETFISSDNQLYQTILNYYKQKRNTTIIKKINNCVKNDLLTSSFFYNITDSCIVRNKRDGTKDCIKYPTKSSTRLLNFDENLLVLDHKEPKLVIGNKIIYNAVKTDDVIKKFISDKFYLIEKNSIINYNNTNYLNYKKKIYKIQYKNNTLSTQFLFNSPFNELSKFSYSQKENIYIFGNNKNGAALVYPNYFNCIKLPNVFDLADYAIIKKKDQWYNYNGWVYNTKLNKITNRKISNYYGNLRFLLHHNGDYFYQAINNDLISILDLKTKASFKLNKKLFYLTGFTYFENKLWLSNEKGIGYLINNQVCIDGYINKILKKNQVINAISSLNANLIVATTQGVFIYKPLSNQIKYIHGLENVNARYIKPINKNSFWLGCYGNGLFLVKNYKAYKVIDINRDIRTPHAVEEDELGNLWIPTNEGLLTLNKKTAMSNIVKKAPVESYIFTLKDGLPTNEFNGGSTFPSLNDNGILGFPSMNGFVWFNPKNIKKHLFDGKITIDEILIDNRRKSAISADNYIIPKDVNLITLKFRYGYLFNNKNLTISYKFTDQNKWIRVEGNKIDFPRYKNGIHNLLIKIKTNGFADNKSVIKSIKLNFEPKNIEKYWFWVVICIMLCIFLYFSFLIGDHTKKQREKQLENVIDQRTSELQERNNKLVISEKLLSNSLLEKELLFKELHHRVKNNLQLIISMLNIQARRNNFMNIQEFLLKGETRIKAMALIHEILYQTEESVDKIDFQTYLQNLTNSIEETLENEYNVINVYINANENILNLTTAIPVGLIINELVTNAYKHAFPYNGKGNITIILNKLENNKFALIVEDDGIGSSFTNKESKTFGKELVHLLTVQLNGKLNFERNNGTKYYITFEEIIQ